VRWLDESRKNMTVDEFVATLKQPAPPAGLSPVLEALWQDAAGHWEAAHGIAQNSEGTPEYDRLHAYLHRKEGDESNARYWYHRARSSVFEGSLEQEWKALAMAALTK
jgi:hypothetical protein